MEESNAVAPLEAVRSPFSYLAEVPSSYDIVSVIFTVLFLLWAVYTVIAIYHWLRYGRGSWIAVPAVAVHLFVSGALMLFATTGFH